MPGYWQSFVTVFEIVFGRCSGRGLIKSQECWNLEMDIAGF